MGLWGSAKGAALAGGQLVEVREVVPTLAPSSRSYWRTWILETWPCSIMEIGCPSGRARRPLCVKCVLSSMGRRWWSGPPTPSQLKPVTSWVSQWVPPVSQFHVPLSWLFLKLWPRSGHFSLDDLPNVSQHKSFPPCVTVCLNKVFSPSYWIGSVPHPSRQSGRTLWGSMVSTFESYAGA